MYVRFVGDNLDKISQERTGIFQIAHDFLDGDRLSPDERTELRTHLDWFDRNLPSPRRLSPFRDGWRRGYRESWRRRTVAISWFKPAAQEHIARSWQIARILERHGIAIEMLRIRKPGYVTHEDAWQVVAMPFVED